MMKQLFILITSLVIVVFFVGCKGDKANHKHGLYDHTHKGLATSEYTDYFAAYSLEDEKLGSKTTVTLTDDERIMVTNSLPNHATGEFPNAGNPNTISAQNRTFSFPLNPKYNGKAKRIKEPGIALNGIKFDPGTGEVVVCESGENYRVEAFQEMIDMGLDFNNAHVQPSGSYHYHGAPTGVISEFDTGEDLVHVGFAFDGFPIYYSKSEAYKPSYKLIDGKREGEDCEYNRPELQITLPEEHHHDGTFGSDYEYVEHTGDLDQCNGITIDGQYMYLITNEFPYVSRCLMGEFESQEHGGPPQGSTQGGQGIGGERPSVKELFEKMDTNTDGKIDIKEAQGPLKQKFSEVDSNSDGYISNEELEKDLVQHKGAKRRP